MSDRQQVFVALLRGINVGGRNRIPMAQLRSICAGINCQEIQSYIQSGNLVFTSLSWAEALEQGLERAIGQAFPFSVPVIVRRASSWSRYVKGNPFPNESKKEANRVLLSLSKLPPRADAASELQQRAIRGDRVVKKDDAIWIHCPNGVGRSNLTPAMLDRYVGSPVTARNWRTVLKLDEMIRETTAE